MAARISDMFWMREQFNQRMSTKEWEEILLADRDSVFIGGRSRRLSAKAMGCGVVEVSLDPLPPEDSE